MLKCRHCGEWLDAGARMQEEKRVAATQDLEKRYRRGRAFFTCLAVFAWFLITVRVNLLAGAVCFFIVQGSGHAFMAGARKLRERMQPT